MTAAQGEGAAPDVLRLYSHFGAFDLKAGALGSLYNVGVDARLNHEFAVDGGLMPDECAALVSQFFARRRA